MSLHIVILAAGQGKRMHSKTPKVLHKLGGKPMLMHVVECARQLNPRNIHVIIGHQGLQIKNALSALDVHWVAQDLQLGTGHAVLQALPFINDEDDVLILSADVPLIQADTLNTLFALYDKNKEQSLLSLLVAKLSNPFGLGRIVRDESHSIQAIVEEKDASALQKSIPEIYSGICMAQASALKRWLPKLSQANAQGEYYLTEIIALARQEEKPILSYCVEDPIEILGVNDRLQLQVLERALQQKIALQLMQNGVSLADSARIDVRGTLLCEQDVFIDVNAVFEGHVTLKKGCTIGPNCIIKNSSIGSNCEILANSVLEECQIGEACQIGPFARLRPGTNLGPKCKIGNFVETKNAHFEEGCKANHLSYIGDAQIGKKVNIGAGTITCNYDGANKHQTIIADDVFIGSGSQLVAPITIGKKATVGAGSTLRKDAPAGELTLCDSRQKTVTGWKRPQKKEITHS